MFVQVKDDGSWKTDFLDRIPEITAPAPKEILKPKEPEQAPKPAPVRAATEPIGIIAETTSPAPAPEPPAPEPAPLAPEPESPAPPPVVAAPKPVPPPPQAVAPSPPPPSSSVELPSVDLPIPIIAGGALAAFAAATFAMRGNVDEREAAQSGSSASTLDEAVADVIAKTEEELAPEETEGESAPEETEEESAPDLSIPYDAAAQLAYEKSDKKMTYDKFRAKYEADAIADVKAKQNKK